MVDIGGIADVNGRVVSAHPRNVENTILERRIEPRARSMI
jgi:hypothetical protein